MKIKLVLFLTLFSSSIFAFDKNDAYSLVNKLYSCQNEILTEQYDNGEPTDNFLIAQEKLLSICTSPNIRLLDNITKTSDTEDSFIPLSTYITRLFNFAVKTRNNILKWEIESVEEVYQITSGQKKDNNIYGYDVHVKKKFVNTKDKNNIRSDSKEIVHIKGEIQKITHIDKNSLLSDLYIDPDVLMHQAAKLFTQKRYEEAYDTYLRTIRTFEFTSKNIGEAYYRLGLMTYFKPKSCKKHFTTNKERRIKAREYIKIASEKAEYKIRELAINVLYYMDNGA